MTNAPDMVCLSPNHWTGLPTSKKHLMQIFARSGRVLFVEPPIDVFSVLGRRRRWSKLTGLRRVAEGPWVLPAVVAGTRSRTAWRARFHERRAARVRGACEAVGIRSPVVWAFAPEHIAYAGALGELLLIYYVTDEPTTLASDKEETRQMDRALVERADIVFGLSEGLRAARSASGKKAHRLRSAADRRHFAGVLAGDESADIDGFLRALDRPRLAPRELKEIDRPLILFAGAAYAWFHHELLFEVASMRPDWRFALVGPRGPALAGSRLPANVLAVGRKPYGELPWYIARADVTFIPIRKGGTYDNCDPVIVYEYLLCGKPVVATPYPSAVELSEFVSTAETPGAFADAIERALAGANDAGAVRRRVEFAFANTWEERAAQALRIISSHGAGGGAAGPPTGGGARRPSEDRTASRSGEQSRCR